MEQKLEEMKVEKRMDVLEKKFEEVKANLINKDVKYEMLKFNENRKVQVVWDDTGKLKFRAWCMKA